LKKLDNRENREKIKEQETCIIIREKRDKMLVILLVNTFIVFVVDIYEKMKYKKI